MFESLRGDFAGRSSSDGTDGPPIQNQTRFRKNEMDSIHPQTLDQTPSMIRANASGKHRKTLLVLVASACFAFFAMTSAAQAIYVGFDPGTRGESNPIIDMRIGDRSISILSGKTQVTINNAEMGIHLSFELDYKTIRFNDGPVALNRIDWKHPGGKLFAQGERGLTAIGQDASLQHLVSSVTSIGSGLRLSAYGIDVDSVAPPVVTTPVPEPGAALLFSAGLLAVGVQARRQR